MPPQVSLAWRGPLAAPRRDTDASALAASLAAIHLTKELERVEAMEAEMRRIRAEREKRDAEAKAEEEKRQREAALKAEEEKRQREAAAKAEEERRQREAALKAEQEKRQREAAAKAEEERRQRDAAAKTEDERRRREAESRSERDALKALIEGTAPTGSPPTFKVPDIISPSR
jgi:membrane protein involved in colicin uptake